MDQIQAAVDAALPSTKFQIFSGILKASRSADGRMRLHGVASSTTKDLHGDTMEPSAIEAMERAANNNLTIFLNHSYEVPEDVAGSVESARMKTRGVDANGNPNYDLDMDILVNDANERAVKAFEAIERGTKLGLSIGALIPEGGATKAKGGNYLINNVELLETSLVGIPANPRSWVEYAAKSLRGTEKDATTIPLGQPTLTLDGNNWSVTGTLDQTIIAAAPPVDEPVIEITNAACPSCGKGKGEDDDCSDAYHTKEVTPDVADSTVTVIQIDTDSGSSSSDAASSDTPASQDAAPSNPETEVAADGDDVVVTAAVDLDGPTLVSVVEKYASAVSELLTVKRVLNDMTIERDGAIRERDAAKDAAIKVAAETQRVLTALADTPLMRKAVVMEAQQALSKRLDGIYSESVLKLLEKD